jgi:phosphoglycerol transferase MdoB-like AlkP superfamily enzyme
LSSAFFRNLKEFVSRGAPTFARPTLVLAALIVAYNVVFLAIVAETNEFELNDAFIVSSFVQKILFDVALLFLGVHLLTALTRASWPAALFLTFNFLLALANILLYRFGNTMVERHHFALIEPYSVTAFVPVWGFVVIAMAVVLVFLVCRFLLSRRAVAHPMPKAAFCFLALVALTGLGHAGLFKKVKDARLDRQIMKFRNAQVRYACRNQLLSLVKDVAFPALGSRLKHLSPAADAYVEEYVLSSDRFTIEPDLSKHARAIADWKLPLGASPATPPLELTPFTRVILVATESMSLEALPCHNAKIGAEYATRFFCRADIVEETFTNFLTTGSPTLQGLTVMFESHPNFDVQEPARHPHSFPRLLEEHGWTSAFVRSASKYFANEKIVFKNMGFSAIIGREDFYEDPSLRKYIYGWGLEDRILYQKAAEYLDANRDRKLFVAILGTDTHPPQGRVHFDHLTYPKRPKLRESVPKAAYDWIRAVDAMDHDLDLFMKDLEARGLFDERTLIVFSADHSCPVNNVTAKIAGHPRANLARIPVIFLSKQKLPGADRATLASQVDLAPTLFHLLGLPGSPAWWGTSLFDPNRRPYAIGFDKGFVHVRDADTDVMIDVEKPADEREEAFLELFRTVLARRHP